MDNSKDSDNNKNTQNDYIKNVQQHIQSCMGSITKFISKEKGLYKNLGAFDNKRSKLNTNISRLIWNEYKDGRGLVGDDTLQEILKTIDGLSLCGDNADFLLDYVVQSRKLDKSGNATKLDKEYISDLFTNMNRYRRNGISKKEKEYLYNLEIQLASGADSGFKPEVLGKQYSNKEEAAKFFVNMSESFLNQEVLIEGKNDLDESVYVALSYDHEDIPPEMVIKAVELASGIPIKDKGVKENIKRTADYYTENTGDDFFKRAFHYARYISLDNIKIIQEKSIVNTLDEKVIKNDHFNEID